MLYEIGGFQHIFTRFNYFFYIPKLRSGKYGFFPLVRFRGIPMLMRTAPDTMVLPELTFRILPNLHLKN
jgi:hypothetical protein